MVEAGPAGAAGRDVADAPGLPTVLPSGDRCAFAAPHGCGRGLRALFLLSLLLVCPNLEAVIDDNADQMSDVWAARFDVGGLSASGDWDADGYTNLQESLLGTDPFDPASRISLFATARAQGGIDLSWSCLPAKRYHVETANVLGEWSPFKTLSPLTPLHTEAVGQGVQRIFTRVRVEDADTDLDGLTDWEELAAGFNPNRVFSEGLGSNPATPTTGNPRITDLERARALLTGSSQVVSIAAVDPMMEENWPDPGMIVVRRSGRLDPLTVGLAFGGSATAGQDYEAPAMSAVTIPFGADEGVISLLPLADSLDEGTTPETITVTLQPGAGYTLGTTTTTTLSISDGQDGRPSAKAASRFLTQATFGPEPVELGRVRNLGFAGWLDDQFNRPVNLHLPLLHVWQTELGGTTNAPRVNTEHRIEVWWRQAMRTDVDSDPLRQRVAFALSQIFVISDRMSSLSADQRGMASYQDMLLTNAFGNYRTLLESVTRHPWMGLYLSALRNRKAEPSVNRFPDENYAREVMQLFSIGLWLLNPDGTLRRSDGAELGPDGLVVASGQPIPTYGETQIGVMARIFTGLSYSKRFTSSTDLTEIPTTRFTDSVNIPWHPMRMWDLEHDVAAKTLWLPGRAPLELPARAASNPDTGAAGDADLAATLDYLASHPNVGPFISRQLIQRLVTSNPTPNYISRVSAVFADNGSGVRGDLKAVVRAILLDTEAREPDRMADPAHGQVREPYTRFVAFARALEAAPADATAGGRYRGFGSLDGDLLQRPLSAPSVFNFYSPDYLPPGEMTDAGLVSPEMQVINSVTAITGPNRFSSALAATSVVNPTQVNPAAVADDGATPGVNESLWNTRVNEARWLPLTHGAPERLVQELDFALCRGTMTPATFRAVTRAIARLNDPAEAGLTEADRQGRERQRFRIAAHLVSISTEASVLK